MKTLSAVAFVCILGSLAVRAEEIQSSPTVNMKICSLLNNPSKYDEKLVNFRARVEQKSFEYAFIVSNHCRGAIELKLAERNGDETSLVKLGTLLAHARKLTQTGNSHVVYADVVGVFHKRSPEKNRMGNEFEVISALNVILVREDSRLPKFPVGKLGRSN